MPAPKKTARAKTPTAAPEGRGREPRDTNPTFTEIGEAAKRDAQRVALLKELKAQDWNLSAVARVLGMGDASAVIRAIRKVDLSDEYEAARARGDVRPGARQPE